MTQPRIGNEGRMYTRPTAAGAGAWTLINNVVDVTTDRSREAIDTTSRATQGYVSERGGLRRGTVSFQMPWVPNDAGLDAISAAFEANTPLGFAILDSDGTAPSTAKGVIADFNILNFTKNEPLRGMQTVDITLSIANTGTAPVVTSTGLAGAPA